MRNDIIQLISAFIGSAGFALVFNVRLPLVISASVGGLLTWTFFLVGKYFTNNYFIACFIASSFSALYGEIMARWKHAPASVFFIPAVVSLIPGGSLFYTMSNAVKGQANDFLHNGSLTVQYALGIACGISVTWAIWYMCKKIIDELKKDNKNE